MFEKASRMRLRFPYKGQISVEDLWDVPFKGLDEIFKKLNAQAKTENEESLLTTKREEDSALALAIAIVRRIYDIRMQEKKLREDADERSLKKKRIMELIEKKQDDALGNLSVDELNGLLASL
jgi:hypothetical protein